MNTNNNSCTVSLATTAPRCTAAALDSSSARVSSPSGSIAVACPVSVRNTVSSKGNLMPSARFSVHQRTPWTT